MKISAILKSKSKVFSFEFFPPKTEEDSKALFTAMRELNRLKPDFVSVTHHPGGTASLKTGALAGVIKDKIGLEPMAHLTCISHSKKEIAAIVSELKKLDIKNILALRGDVPKDVPNAADYFKEYSHANELVADLHTLGDFSIGVAGYPEKHPQSADIETDIKNLKSKVDAGADFIITQLFFNNSAYFEFKKRCTAAGINVPIIPGIMPVTNYSQLQRFATMCGAVIPQKLHSDLEKIKDSHTDVLHYGIEYAVKQCSELLTLGAPGIHFYTLNKSKATIEILQQLERQ